ncbi:hypothetical protein ACS0TY_025162 [Phlomoides rotata]
MATKLKFNSSSSSSSSSFLKISTKFHHLLVVIVGFLFLFVALVNSSKPSSTSTTLPQHEKPFFPDSSTTNFRAGRRESRKAKTMKRRDQFEASDHEVPSGPNPISNR